MAITGTPSDICLPVLGFCNPGGGNPTRGNEANPYFTPCDNKFNQNRCRLDPCYRMPYVEGDEINIAVTGILGILSADVVQLDGSPLPFPASVLITATPSGMSYVNVTVPAGNPCFTIKITDPRATYCTQFDYEFVNCEQTFKIRGLYEDGETDCFGVLYPFDNTIRLRGYLVRGKSDTIEKTRFGDFFARKKVESYYELIIKDFIPPYVHDLLVKQILLGNTILVTDENDIEYELVTEDSFTLASEDIRNTYFYYGKSLRLKSVCKVQTSCEY